MAIITVIILYSGQVNKLKAQITGLKGKWMNYLEVIMLVNLTWESIIKI